MLHTPLHRGLAVLLCVQPIFWMSNVALAQSLDHVGGFVPPSAGGLAAPGPVAPTDTEVVRADRAVISQNAVLSVPLEEPLDPDKYICGRGDVFELNFWGMQNFKLRVAIDLEGRAFVSKVGYLNIQGRTLTEARKILREQVGRYYPRLSFDVNLVTLRTFLVHVVATVGHAGVYSARQIDRVSSAIAQAGGVGKGGSQRRIEIHRRDGSVLYADLLRYSLTGDGRYNPPVLDGDVIQVPVEGLAATIGGAVHRPGRYELTAAKDLAELLDLAGGLDPSATHKLPMRLVRRTPDDRRDQKLFDFGENGQLPPMALQHEDVVSIPGVGELEQSVTVIGAIAGARLSAPAAASASDASGGSAVAGAGSTAPEEASATRRLPYVEGDTVRTLLERVGGVGPLADLEGGYILRNGKSLSLDLYALVMLRDMKADRPVELGDTVVVPFKRRNILVEGAVFSPGSYPYNPAFGVEQYLSLAGGRSRNAQSLSNVKVISPSGETRSYSSDLKIEAGSSIVVPERTFSRSEVVQIILGTAGVIMSAVAIGLAAARN